MSIQLGRDHRGTLNLETEVVIVGSGAGGAVAARLFAEAGKEVLILEEGGHVRPDEHARMRPSQSLRHLWRDAGMTASFGLGDSPLINVMMGKGVGGSSALTGGVCFRVPDRVLGEWHDDLHLHDFTPEGLEPHYQEVEANVGVHDVPEELWSKSTKLFGRGLNRLGHSLKPMRRNTQGCIGWSSCNFGCPVGAKLSVDRSYLPQAFAAGAKLWADCRVDKVVIENDRAAGVTGKILGGKKGGPKARFRVKAKHVILAAGSVYTPLILGRSGIGRSSNQVGRNLTLHPAFRIMARFNEPVMGWKGALQSAFCSDFEPEGIQFNSVFIPGGILAATQPGVGSEHHAGAARLANLAMFGANLHDLGGGRVHRFIGREPLITYRLADRDRLAMRRSLQLASSIFEAAGAVEIFLPIIGEPGIAVSDLHRYDFAGLPGRRLECTSQHPLGTARMGTTASSSVVNPEHEVWEVPGLFVADGSVVPTSLGVNPQLTIMTLATRFARSFLNRN